MKAFHTSNRAPRNCWRVRLMWNNPVLRVMEYEALPRVFTMACGLFDDMPCLQPFPKPVLTYVSVCQARTLTHTNHEPSMRTESVGDQGKQALAADKSPESGDDFTEVSTSRAINAYAVNPRNERALHISVARSGHLRKVVPALGGFVCSQCLLALVAHTRGYRQICDDTLALASAPGFGVSAGTHGLTDALMSTDAARRDDACPDAAGRLSLLDASKPTLVPDSKSHVCVPD